MGEMIGRDARWEGRKRTTNKYVCQNRKKTEGLMPAEKRRMLDSHELKHVRMDSKDNVKMYRYVL